MACELLLGTSSWTAPSWSGPFYPKGLPSGEYLAHYATHFPTVEIDSTWYAAPSPQTVAKWANGTPPDFRFAAKVPRIITHEKQLRNCETDLELFVEVMQGLGPKLGPLLFQFPYFNQESFPNLNAFLDRLVPLLGRLPKDVRFAVEVRNKGWLQRALFEALREHGVALAWVDLPQMPTARQWGRLTGACTADFLYVRLLGDRHGIEHVTKKWDEIVVDRTREIAEWVETCGRLVELPRAFVYHNNHFAGCGYQSAEQFRRAWSVVVG